ncbi:hypothetical protein ID866_10235 [Astraeus odoratus]|nr:hypothetical protein ID866_10235 [Astraeus odoratus]
MAIIQPPSKVLVSGANGYVAMWVVQEFLEHGYAVRGTVRSAERGKHLKKQFAKYGDKLEIVVVEDITKEGAFDEAVKGIDAIAHTASPFYLNAQLIEPAVKGTVGILQSTLKHSTTVKRVVITSSAVAVMHNVPTPTTFTEEDWNLQSVEIVKEKGENAPSGAMYQASKTLAEQAAWKFVEDHKQEMSWDVAVVNPPFVSSLLPAIHEVTGLASLNTSAKLFYDHVADASMVEAEYLSKTGGNWIDVRDLAAAHRLALEKPDAGNERIIVSAGAFKWQDFVDAANALRPAPKLSKPLPKGIPGSGTAHPHTIHMVTYDVTKVNRILGLKYRSIAETTLDTLTDYEARGW